MTTGRTERRVLGTRQNATVLEEARDLYARGDLETAAALLDLQRDPHDIGAALLHAEIAIRTGAAERARAFIREHLPERDPKAIVRGHLLLASASLACDDPDGATAALDVVRDASHVAIEREEEALYRARLAFRAGDLKRYRDAIKIASGSADSAINARAHRLAGDTLVVEGRLADGFAEYGRALSALATGPPRDDRLLATLIAFVGFGEAEFESAEPGSTLRAIDARDWHPALAPIVAIALDYAGRHLSRRSRFAEATATLVRAAMLGGETPAAVAALAFAHTNARDCGELFAAHGFLESAIALARRLAWESLPAVSTDALVALALALARTGELALARTFLLRRNAIAGAPGAMRRGPHHALLIGHASALIAASTPETRDEGILRLRDVRHELSRLGFAWRAIEIRADLYAVTGQSFLLEANRLQRRELTRSVEDAAGARVASSLSPQQMRIVAAVARGNATNDIALELTISARTVKNQLHKIYQKLEIDNPSREKLVAYVHANPRLGLSADA